MSNGKEPKSGQKSNEGRIKTDSSRVNFGAMSKAIKEPATISNLCVLLGPDYAGKTEAMGMLRKNVEGGRFFSYDNSFLGSYASLIGTLKTEFIRRYHRNEGNVASHEFLMSLLHPIIYFLRDQALSHPTAPIVLIDGYYYKILVKCVLHGMVEEGIFSWWRSFPQPRHIIYLDVDPNTAWERSGHGKRLNPSEYYGKVPNYEGFQIFQNDFRKTILREVSGLPVSIVQGCGELTQTVAEIGNIIGAFRHAQ